MARVNLTLKQSMKQNSLSSGWELFKSASDCGTLGDPVACAGTATNKLPLQHHAEALQIFCAHT
jgi:hypothetical protein